ncbi:MAG TPA: VOC family protein [Egibacteraceae bacterium]|jgi:predicted enzyme related to lactoylglutathione lyase|nr:VOC family protein [Egibacteraceae bacterium]
MTITEVIIQVGDVDEAVGFYTDVCGFAHVRTVEHEGVRVAEMDAGGQRVSLVPSRKPGVQLALASDDVAATRRRLKRMKIPMDAERPEEVDGAAWLPFTDPWGNHLGYWQPPG